MIPWRPFADNYAQHELFPSTSVNLKLRLSLRSLQSPDPRTIRYKHKAIQLDSYFRHLPSEADRYRATMDVKLEVAQRAAVSLASCTSQPPPLVYTRISHRVAPLQNPDYRVHLEQYRRDVRVRRRLRGGHARSGGGKRGSVQAFSEASRARLKFVAGNSCPELVSQIALTYHNVWGDGRRVKRDLDVFLKWLRRRFAFQYLWILEFQTRGAPHFHLFLTVPPSHSLRKLIAKQWTKIAAPGDVQHEAFHAHQENWIDWTMHSGAYLTKYLDKEAQKAVPEGFEWVGRFWGSSRGLVPAPAVHDVGTGQTPRSMARIIRGLGRWHERRLGRWGRKSHVREAQTSSWVRGASVVLDNLLKYEDTEKQVMHDAREKRLILMQISYNFLNL